MTRYNEVFDREGNLVSRVAVPYTDEEFSVDLPQYREKVISETLIEHNTVQSYYDNTSMNRIQEKISWLMKKNDPALTINWKGPNGYSTGVTLADLEGLNLKGGNLVQKAFDAEKFVSDKHAQTAYTSFEDAKTDFDNFMEG